MSGVFVFVFNFNFYLGQLSDVLHMEVTLGEALGFVNRTVCMCVCPCVC